MVSQRRFISMLRHTDISRVVSLKCGGIHAVFFSLLLHPASINPHFHSACGLSPGSHNDQSGMGQRGCLFSIFCENAALCKTLTIWQL
jgi:hypothetical protein